MRFINTFRVLLIALLIVFSLPHGSVTWAYDYEQKAATTAEGGQGAASGSGNTASGVASAGAGAATGLKELALSAIIVGVVVLGALLAASASSDAGPIPTTSHHP